MELEAIFTAEQQQLRKEIRTFISQYDGYNYNILENEYDYKKFYKKLGEKGWLAINWPSQYGGLGKTQIDAAIVTEELGISNFADRPHNLTIDIAGQFIFQEGNNHQKNKYLHEMATGNIFFSILYSEKEAGSDLASLKTKAEYNESTQSFKIYGTKVYSIHSEHSDYAICVVRTKESVSKYDGISLFIVPLHDPNVQVKTISTISEEEFCEVILEGVEVGFDELIGNLHQGWTLLNKALMIERTGLDFNVKIRKWIYQLENCIRNSDLTIFKNVNNLQKLETIKLKACAGELMAWSIIYQNKVHQYDEVSSAMSKLYNSELSQDMYELMLDIKINNTFDHPYALHLIDKILSEIPGLTIAAGTSEIMLQIISASFFDERM